MILPSLQLVCGGLAGSTAALFTTPFDVVKTRVQTQVCLIKKNYGSLSCNSLLQLAHNFVNDAKKHCLFQFF